MAQFACNNNKFFGFNFAAEYLYETSKTEILNILEYSDFIFCNKEEARAARKYLGAELGIPASKESSNELEELESIALHVAQYSKTNTSRPRVTIITNSEQPVTVAVSDHSGDKAYSFAVNVSEIPSE